MQDRSFVVAFFVSFLLVIGGISFFNYTIDSTCEYSRFQLLERLADDVLAGNIVAGEPFFQSRLFQKVIINKMKKIPHTIAIGSSRTMELRASYLGLDRKSFFNHSVPYAVLDDYIAILGCYEEKGVFPHTIIMGVDPFVFDEKTGSTTKWKPLVSSYYTLLPFLGGDISGLMVSYEVMKVKISKALRLLSYTYIDANYKYFQNVRKRGFDYKVVNSTSIDEWLTGPDGSLYRPFSFRFQKDWVTLRSVKTTLHKRREVERYTAIAFQETFTSLIDYLLNNGTRVVFFLHPYHPLIYKEFEKKNPSIVPEIEKMLRAFARLRNIEVIGSYDPKKLNLSSQAFINFAHSHDYTVERIFRRYKQTEG